MTALAIKQPWISPEAYLAREEVARTKHEYVNGRIYAMAGGRNIHNQIVTNVLVALALRLKGKKCQPFNSDTKVRVPTSTGVDFYYPDVQVTCRPNPPDDVFQDHPTLIVEVLSKRTQRYDEGEKRYAYQSIPSLKVYLVMDSTHALVTSYTRTAKGFVRRQHWGKDAMIKLACIGTELPLTEIYEGTNLPSLEVVK